jgi:hypothetical protein
VVLDWLHHRSGTWLLAGMNTISEATTINMINGTVDLDNSAVSATIANDTFVNTPITINVATMANYGSSKAAGVTTFSELTIDNLGAETGSLTVNLTDPNGEWTVADVGIVSLVNDNSPATLLAGSAINLNGTLNVTGDVRTTARLDIGAAGEININTPGEPFRFSGGSFANPRTNTISGGTIDGPGILGADFFDSLVGFGTINADVNFGGGCNLLADNGVLNVNGSIIDAGVVGTAGDDGIFIVVNAWSTNSVVLDMLGGEVRGGTITNDNPFWHRRIWSVVGPRDQ